MLGDGGARLPLSGDAAQGLKISCGVCVRKGLMMAEEEAVRVSMAHIQRLTALMQDLILNKPVQLPEEIAPETGAAELYEMQKTVSYLAKCLSEANGFLSDLCAGHLETKPPPRHNFLAGSLKELHARLNHIAYQASCVAKGDYTQRLAFFGDFSAAFNQMTQQLAERESRLRQKSEELDRMLSLLLSLMDRQSEAIFVLDAETQAVLYVNQAARANFCDAAGQLLTSPELAPLYEHVRRQMGREDMPRAHCFLVKDRYFEFAFDSVLWEGRKAVVYTVEEKTEAVREKQKLEYLAYQDSLTETFNRRYGEELFDAFHRKGTSCTLIFADLDHLKYVNDTFGHAAGDEYILSFVASLRRQLRGQDRICRVGGDEFLIFLPECPEETARERMAAVYTEFVQERCAYPRSFSYGMEHIDQGMNLSYEEAYHRLDAKMYAAKRRKGNRRGRL